MKVGRGLSCGQFRHFNTLVFSRSPSLCSSRSHLDRWYKGASLSSSIQKSEPATPRTSPQTHTSRRSFPQLLLFSQSVVFLVNKSLDISLSRWRWNRRGAQDVPPRSSIVAPPDIGATSAMCRRLLQGSIHAWVVYFLVLTALLGPRHTKTSFR